MSALEWFLMVAILVGPIVVAWFVFVRNERPTARNGADETWSPFLRKNKDGELRVKIAGAMMLAGGADGVGTGGVGDGGGDNSGDFGSAS